MATINDQMTEIYVFVDDYLKKHPKLAQWRNSPNNEPELSDSEVITIGLMQSCIGVSTLKKAYQHMRNNYAAAFPHLCSYQRWISRLHQLGEIIGHLIEAARKCDGFKHSLYLIDSKPMPVCKPIRHWRVRLLREDGAYWGKTAKGWFFGFKMHVVFNIDGHAVSAALTPGSLHDQDLAVALGLSTDGGIMLGDLAYKGQAVCRDLADEADLLMITRKHAPDHKALISSIRQRIETFLSKLWSLFIDLIFSRSWLGLWNTAKLKLLFYNLRHAGLLS